MDILIELADIRGLQVQAQELEYLLQERIRLILQDIEAQDHLEAHIDQMVQHDHL